MTTLDDRASAQPHDPAVEEVDAHAEPIAVIGLACRVPGAADAGQFWDNLVNGVESVRTFTPEEQLAIGVPRHKVEDPQFVPRAAVVDDYDALDAGLFGMTPREAEIKDPQQRLFLELAHSALEDAGYDPARYEGDIGVYGGVGADEYQWKNIVRNPPAVRATGLLSIATSNHADYLATYVSYKLDLRGPSLTVHTACSTSLVAIHLAIESLRNGECEMALSGAATLDLPQGSGYVYSEGSIMSPDGSCRPFDASAGGTIWASGGGVVVLKRLSDAIEDGDTIRAVIRGNAINNDGSAKVGFSAPSVEGQAAVVAQALGVAGVDPRTVSYVEAHGTGTALGDPIEVTALSSVFGESSDDTGWCGLGSLKSNLGHLGPAAGVAGLIKVVLSLENGVLPPSINYRDPHPQIDFPTSPFYVNADLATWPNDDGPRRAGVSSFGIGGTNAHVVVEEAPPAPAQAQEDDAPDEQVLMISARNESALLEMTERLAEHLDAESAAGRTGLADVAWTLRQGRRLHSNRVAVVASDASDAATALRDKRRRIQGRAGTPTPQVAMLFSGQGAQFAGMGAALYTAEPVYRDAVDACAQTYRNETGEDLLALLHATGDQTAESELARTVHTQPALFTVEYALSRLWASWGVEPAAMIGHSIGELVAAAVAGVMDPDDALRLVIARGRLMQSMPPGSMMAVQADADDVRPLLPAELTIATVNGPGTCVVAGPTPVAEAFAAELEKQDIGAKLLKTSHAFHSPMMEPILAEFQKLVADLDLRPPTTPFLSNVTGDWITDEQATDPAYWARHLRETVLFGTCLETLLASGDPAGGWALLEVGPGRQLMGAARMQTRGTDTQVLRSLPAATDREGDLAVLLDAAARLWSVGVEVDLDAGAAPRRRVRLPGYAYQRRRFWVEPLTDQVIDAPEEDGGDLPLDQWFAMPSWREQPTTGPRRETGRTLVIVRGPAGHGVAGALSAAGDDVVEVRVGGEHGLAADPAAIALDVADRGAFDGLVTDLAAGAGIPSRIVDASCLDLAADADVETATEYAFYGPLLLAQALAAGPHPEEIALDVLTRGALDVAGTDLLNPEQALVAGPVRVLPLELPWLTARQIDVDDPAGPGVAAALLSAAPGDLAVRGRRHWQQEYHPSILASDEDAGIASGIRPDGVYLITGGLGGIGITVAEDLATRDGATVVLQARTPLPPREEWATHVAVHGTVDRIGRAIAAIERIEAAGGRVLVVAADVADAEEMRAARGLILERFGRLDGIVHAAGVPGGGMAEIKERAAADAVLAPKVTGTRVLGEVFGDLDLDFVALCSSVTALAGGFGQVDYCAGNNVLDALARSAPGRSGFRAPVVSINWGGWLDVGMAAEVDAPQGFRALQRGMRSIDVEHPVVTAAHTSVEEAVTWCTGIVSPRTHWLLDEHRIAGRAVIPGTGLLESVRAAADAALEHGTGAVPDLRDVVFLAPFAVPDDGQSELRISFAEGAEGPTGTTMDFQVSSQTAGSEQVHTRGGVRWLDPAAAAPAPVDVAAVLARCGLKEVAASELGSHSGMLTFGPRWTSLQRVHLGVDEELARLEAGPTVAGDLDAWVLHPALLDEATSFGLSRGSGRYLPISYGSLRVYGPTPASLWSHLRYRDGDSDEVIVADFTLFADDGTVVAEIEEFMLRRVDADQVDSDLSATVQQADSATGDTGPRERGIVPADGAEALRRILSHQAGPQVSVTVSDIREVIAGARQVTQRSIEEQLGEGEQVEAAERTVDTDYVAPRSELESQICTVWEAVLGVGQVGIEDDFFELGGNSLVAVQLMSRIRDAIGEKLPMRTLFEAPTVAGMAATVGAARAEAEAKEQGATAASTGADAAGDEMVIPRRSRAASEGEKR